MMIRGGIQSAAPAGQVQLRPLPQARGLGGCEGKFDQVQIAGGDSFQKQLLGRLSQEVRAATTTGTVAALRGQVRAGEYQVDPHAIARKLLFVWES